MHYSLTWLIVASSGIVIFPIFIPYTLFGIDIKANVVDHFVAMVICSLIDLDHIPAFKKFGPRKYILAEKRFPSPLHNFFFLSIFSILSAFTAIFISKIIGILIFTIVLHMLWDIFEDVFIFRTSYRRWEKTWGLNKKDMEEIYNEILKIEPEQVKKESKFSKIRRIGYKIKNKIRTKKSYSFRFRPNKSH
jgi:hypothetical protein